MFRITMLPPEDGDCPPVETGEDAARYGSRTPGDATAAFDADAGAAPLRKLPFITTLFDEPELNKLWPKPIEP